MRETTITTKLDLPSGTMQDINGSFKKFDYS